MSINSKVNKMKNNTMSRPQQTDKEFVEAAKISEQNIFIAVVIRRITGLSLGIPVRELIADATFDEIMRRESFGADWDEQEFKIEFEVYFNEIGIDWSQADEVAKNEGYSNWFYNPDNYKNFSFLWKPFVSTPPTPKITYGEWVHLITEKFLVPVRDKITPPVDWTGIETSDLVSDTLVTKNSYVIGRFVNCGCWCIIVILLTFICLLFVFK